ncbi:hypothetical protein SUGI_0236440 [Cryptomeria japonica]|nr:hypothetical protein SUGI_0236440 [Cryptomeria japonica]
MSSLATATMGTLLCIVLLLCSTVIVYGQLTPSFYTRSCAQAVPIVKDAVRQAIAREKRMGGSLVRLHFHDCFVNGCDGSILLDDSTNITGEKKAIPNANSARGSEVIDHIKSQLEKVCSGVVSCADILTLAAHESVVQLGGPSWTVSLGRRDSRTAVISDANTNIPSPFLSLPNLISAFQAQGLSASDMVALSGAHTIGQAQCSLFRTRIYNETNISPAFAAFRKASCPSRSGNGDSNLSPLDVGTPNSFDNSYYKILRRQRSFTL